MDKRVFIRLDEDSQLDRIEEIAAELRGSGLAISDISPVVGQITGSVEAADLPAVVRKVQALGVRLVEAAEDLQHRLPPPESGLQ